MKVTSPKRVAASAGEAPPTNTNTLPARLLVVVGNCTGIWANPGNGVWVEKTTKWLVGSAVEAIKIGACKEVTVGFWVGALSNKPYKKQKEKRMSN